MSMPSVDATLPSGSVDVPSAGVSGKLLNRARAFKLGCRRKGRDLLAGATMLLEFRKSRCQ